MGRERQPPSSSFLSRHQVSSISSSSTSGRGVFLSPCGQIGIIMVQWKWAKSGVLCLVASVVSDSVRPHRRQPIRLLCLWDSPGKNTGVGCHFLLQPFWLYDLKWVPECLRSLAYKMEVIIVCILYGCRIKWNDTWRVLNIISGKSWVPIIMKKILPLAIFVLLVSRSNSHLLCLLHWHSSSLPLTLAGKSIG